MARIVEVAKAAGVSTATVSNVLNNRRVAKETQDVVRKAIADLGYEPRRTRSARSRAADLDSVNLLILGESIKSVLRHPVYFNLIHGIERECNEQNIFFRLRALLHEDERRRYTVQKGDGLILFLDRTDHLPSGLLESVPTVKVFTQPMPGIDHVTYADASVGRIAADWLLQQGVSHAGIFSNPKQARTVELVNVLKQNGCEVDACGIPERIGGPDASSELDSYIDDDFFQAELERMLVGDKPIDGLFLYSDEVASHAYGILQVMGVKPQQDLPIIACNNDRPYLTSLRPRPATIDIHVDDVGRAAVEQLLNRAQRPGMPVRSLKIEPTIVDTNLAK